MGVTKVNKYLITIDNDDSNDESWVCYAETYIDAAVLWFRTHPEKSDKVINISDRLMGKEEFFVYLDKVAYPATVYFVYRQEDQSDGQAIYAYSSEAAALKWYIKNPTEQDKTIIVKDDLKRIHVFTNLTTAMDMARKDYYSNNE